MACRYLRRVGDDRLKKLFLYLESLSIKFMLILCYFIFVHFCLQCYSKHLFVFQKCCRWNIENVGISLLSQSASGIICDWIIIIYVNKLGLMVKSPAPEASPARSPAAVASRKSPALELARASPRARARAATLGGSPSTGGLAHLDGMVLDSVELAGVLPPGAAKERKSSLGNEKAFFCISGVYPRPFTIGKLEFSYISTEIKLNVEKSCI